jgi:NAD(P)-dependent dehydrogenase (short-subunit alcohol dehydrogenase family)
VNVLSPGHIDTPILEDLQQGERSRRSDEASYVSGAELYVDGGVAQI